MAERTQQRISDRDDIAADDPFAELTRIMGFDPRVPVRPQDASPAKTDAADEFAIDLEKELMGEFGASEADAAEPEAAPIEASSTEPRYIVEGDIEAASEFDDDVEAALDQDFQFAEDMVLDEAELAGETESTLEERQVSATDDKVADFELQSDARGFDEQADEEFGGFDVVDFELVEAGEEDVAPAGGASTNDFDADFDRAMADVDMDFDARPDEAAAANEETIAAYEPEAELPQFVGHAVTHEAVDEVAPVSDEAEAVMPVAAATDDFDNAGEPAVGQVAQPFDQVAADPADSRNDDSLEDELNALLNKMSARPLPVDEPAAAWAPSPLEEQVDTESHVEADDVDWLPDEAPVAAQEEPVEYAASDDLDAELVEDPAAVEPVEAAADAGEPTEAEIDFDHSAFEAAMAADGEPEPVEEQAHAPEPQAPVAEDPIEALQWLAGKPIADAVAPSRTWSRGTPYIQSQQTPAQQPVASSGPAEPEAFSVGQPAYEVSPAYDVAFDNAEPAVPSETETEAYEAAEPVAASVAAPAYDEMPDVETVDVPERVVALADDLDIPDVPFESEKTEKPIYDDLEAEFTSLLTEMNVSEPASVAAQPVAYDDDAYGAGYKQGGAPDYAKPQQAQASVARNDYDDPALAGFDIDNLPGSRPLDGQGAIGEDDLGFDPDFDEEMSLPDPAEAAAARQPRSRVMMVAALVGAVALIGGIGAFALSFGGGDGASAPVLVEADDNPIKVKPENPGGTVIPNQDNKVYDMVAKGTKPAAPVQEKLVTDAEEPVDVAAKAPEARVVEPAPAEAEADVAAAQPSGKSEERIAPAAVEPAAANDSETALVTPRKVRTMIVKPDGSLVPREEPQPAPAQVAATEPTDPAPQLVVNPTANDQTGAVSPETETQAEAPAAATPATPAPAAATAAAKPQADTQSAATPALAPVAPQRPAEQPVDIVGEVKPDQVAAVDPAGGVAASGAWSMQIASQPSVESAQSTYQDLARRYSSVLEGRSVNIVKAEVAGKGTFYRVRVAANSRNEAVSLCESYKAAGGNCFVSK